MDEIIQPESKVHTLNQINAYAYMEKADPIVDYNCFCHQEVDLLEEKEDYRMSMEYCMSRLHLFLPT